MFESNRPSGHMVSPKLFAVGFKLKLMHTVRAIYITKV